jgi:hypothetical protein
MIASNRPREGQALDFRLAGATGPETCTGAPRQRLP